jgi:PTS system N-acetylglucosamine-specific IIB component
MTRIPDRFGDARFTGLAPLENLHAYSLAMRGVRHTRKPHGAYRAGRCTPSGGRKGTVMGMRETAEQLLAGMGGADNIKSMEPCITRLRVELNDSSKLDEKALRKAGAHGVMKTGKVVQVVVGTQAENIDGEIRKVMSGQ